MDKYDFTKMAMESYIINEVKNHYNINDEEAKEKIDSIYESIKDKRYRDHITLYIDNEVVNSRIIDDEKEYLVYSFIKGDIWFNTRTTLTEL